MTTRSAIAIALYAVAATGLTWLSHALDVRLKTETGLIQTFDVTEPERRRVFSRTVQDIDLDFLQDDPTLPTRFFEAEWNGVWYVPEHRELELYAGADDFVAVRIDRELVLIRNVAVGTSTISAPLSLGAGFHRVRVRYRQDRGGYSLHVLWAPAGGRPRPFDPERLFPTPPTPKQLAVNQRLRRLRNAASATVVVPPLVALVWFGWPIALRVGRSRGPWLVGAIRTAYTALVDPPRKTQVRALTRRVATALGVVVVSSFFGVQLFRGLALRDLANDEAIYSYAVDGIVERGEWLAPLASPQTAPPGDPGTPPQVFLEKPPLKFWIVALPIVLGLLPLDEFGLRFWDALFGAVAFVYVFLIGRRLVDSLCGAGAVFLLFIHLPLMFGHGLRSNVMEAALVLAYAGGIYHFLAWSESDRRSRRWSHIFAFAGWFTLGFMTKFVAVIFLPAVVGLAALCVADWRRRLRTDLWRWSAGALAALLLIAPWFAYAHVVFGDYFWNVIFGAHVYDRMRGALVPGHVQPWSYYLEEIHRQLSHVGAAGWVGIGGGVWCVEAIRRRWSGGLLIVLWCLLPIALLSASLAKLYHYGFPFLPPIALMGAYSLSLLVNLTRKLGRKAVWPEWTAPRVRYGLAALVLAFGLWMWPVQQYGAMIESLGRRARPMSALRECLIEQSETLPAAGSGDVRSGIYAHLPPGEGLTHNYYYYRALGEWERLESPTDVDLYARLFVPRHHAVTLILPGDYERFLQRIDRPEFGTALRALAERTQDPTLIANEPVRALQTGSLPAALMVGQPGTTRALILLPGPLASCLDPALREGGQAFEVDLSSISVTAAS